MSEGTPATLTLENVAAGQYYLMAKVANVSPDDYVDLSAEIDGGYAYLAYNEYAGAYIALVTVDATSNIVLSTYMGSYTVDVYLGGLFMGASTDNSIYGLQIADGMSSTIELENVAADEYYINVQLEYGSALDYGANLYAQLDNGAKVELTYNKNTYSYVAQTAIYGAKALTVSTNNEEKVIVNVSLYPVVSVNTELPMTEAAMFELNEAQCFYYIANKTGYFTISANSTTENAEFGITLKTNPNDLVSTSILNSSFPMYFVAGNTYYFDIKYTGISDTPDIWNVPETVTATFIFNKWQIPTIGINEREYVPVTMNTDRKTVPVKIEGDIGDTYCVGLSNVPFEVEQVTVHYAGEEIVLNGFTCFCGEITLRAGHDTIYFTTDWEFEFVAGVQLCNISEFYDDEIKLDEAKEIVLRAHETLLYFVYNIPAGAYEVTLTDNNGNVIVADAFDNTVIAKGANEGFFALNTYGYPTGTAYLYFTNDGDSAISFSVTVTKGESIVLGEATDITLSATENSKTYYLTGLTAGEYKVIIDATPGTFVHVTLGGSIIINYGVYEGVFTIDIDEYVTTSVALTFTGVGMDANFSVRVVRGDVDYNTLRLGHTELIKLSAYGFETYYIEGLSAGKYVVELTLPNGTWIQVTRGNANIIEYGYKYGIFDVSANGTTVALTFYYSGSNTATFNVLVTQYDDSDIINIDQTKKVLLSAENSAHIYYIEGVTKGLYKINLYNVTTQIQIIVDNKIVVYYGQTNGYFEYLSNTASNLTVIISYNGDTNLLFNLKVSKLPDDLLPLGVKRTVEMSNTENVKQYYLEDLSKGQYKITLTLSNGTEIEILTLNGIIISYGDNVGYFDVQTSVDRLNLIFAYNGSSEVTFTVLVTAV